jgi:hypothetical protein
MQTVAFYRPAGPAEADLILASGWRAFPPRRPAQPIFSPVTNRESAAHIARDWNVKADAAMAKAPDDPRGIGRERSGSRSVLR